MDDFNYFVLFMIGLLGSLHCIGMCGGFPVSLALHSPTHRSNLLRQLLYNTGKIATYGFIGLLMGYLGNALEAWDLFSNFQFALAVISGTLMILIASHILGIAAHLRIPGFLVEGIASFSRVTAAFQKEGKSFSAFYLGLFNGFLPCPLVYAAAAKAAATGSLFSGSLSMLVFGIGTIPALLLLGVSGRSLSSAVKESVSVLSGWIILLLGVITIVRGL